MNDVNISNLYWLINYFVQFSKSDDYIWLYLMVKIFMFLIMYENNF